MSKDNYKNSDLKSKTLLPVFITSSNYRNGKDFQIEKKYKPILDNSNVTEQAGYMSVKQRVENLIDAGIRLKEARMSNFDFPQGTPVDENFEDPTRSKNYDISDATQDALMATANIEKARQHDLELKEKIQKEHAEENKKKKFGKNRQKSNDEQNYHEVPEKETE